MKNNSKEYLFEEMPISRAVVQMSIPMVLSSLVMVFYNLADTYFVGMLNAPAQNAAVALSYPVLLAFNAVNNLFGVGTSSMMSRALGAKQYDKVRRSSAFGLYGAAISGVLFALVCTVFQSPLLTLLGADEVTRAATQSYLFWTVTLGAVPAILNVVMAYMVRSEGASMHASLGTMIGCVLNMVIDPLFIMPWGFNMGAGGAGCATFLSNCVACLYFFILLLCKRGKTFICMDPRQIGWEKSVSMGIMTVGIPASIQNLLNVAGITILNNFVAGYGAEAVAAMGIANKLNMVPMQMMMGTSQGIMPLVSYNYASGNRKRMKKCINFSLAVCIPIMAVVTVGYHFGAEGLVRMFMDNPAIVECGAQFLRGLCLGMVFICIDFTAVHVFQALGMGRNALIFAIVRKAVLEIPAMLLLNALFPLYGLAYAQFCAEFILAAVALVMLRRIMKEPAEQIQKAS